MFFHSYRFILLFLPAVLLCHKAAELFAQEMRVRVRKAVLIAASILFICGFGWECVLAVLCSTGLNYAVARGFFCKTGAARMPEKGRRAALAVALLLNAGVLSALKITAFPIPVGLSFYTFTQIAFLVDAYRGETETLSLPDYLLHVLFFPKFLQGPIMRFADTRRMITGTRLADDMSAANLLNGILLFSLGLAKKVLLADTLGNCVNTAYSLIPHLTRPDAVITILVFVAQLYFDFSAYCDMGMGCAWMLGLDLVENFRTPLRTSTIVSYWKNWHMSLTGFFTRYLYIPLGGSRKGALRRYVNILIVFLVSGFWHGTGLTFLVWGALHGAAYVLVTALSQKKPAEEEAQTKQKSPAGVLSRMLFTVCNYVFVSVCYVFFRAQTMADALKLFERTYGALVSYVSDTVAKTFYMDEILYIAKLTPFADGKYGVYICMAVVLAVTLWLLFFAPDARTMVLRNDKRLEDGGSVRGLLFVLLCALLFVWALVSLGEVTTYLYVNF